MSDNVIEIGKPPRKRGFNTAELDFRIYEIACMATITEAQVTRTLDRPPDDPPELAISAVRKLRDMIHDLRDWYDDSPDTD